MAVSDGIFAVCHISDPCHAGLCGPGYLCGIVPLYRAMDIHVPAARAAAQYHVRCAEAQQRCDIIFFQKGLLQNAATDLFSSRKPIPYLLKTI